MPNVDTKINQPLTIVADANIASLDEFFNSNTLACDAKNYHLQNDGFKRAVDIIRVAGRDIDADLLAQYQPDFLLIRSVTTINEALLADNHSVKFIGSAAIGTDHVDQRYLVERRISFANAAGSSKHSVAQYVITAILTLRPEYGQPAINKTATKPTMSKAVVLGIIGLGNIGSILANYATDLGWQVLGYDPLLPASKFNNASLEQVLSQSNVISLHVPLTDASVSAYPTQHLIDAAALEMMADDTVVINSARGAVIDTAALVADIERNNRQVVLDVFEHEPQVAESLLNKLAIATPHIAGYSLEGKLRGTQMIYDALCHELTLVPEQSMQRLLPPNPYLWSELKAHPDKLSEFYDIKQDDKQLRAQLKQGQVSGSDFDQLRRDYHLRREWQF